MAPGSRTPPIVVTASTSSSCRSRTASPPASPVAVTTMPGDERWPSWTADGRLVFAHRDARPAGRNGDPSLQYDIYLSTPVSGSDAWQAPQAADRNRGQRNLSARVAGRHQGRVRFRARLRGRSRSVVDAGAVGGDQQADSARRPSAEAGRRRRCSPPAPMASRCAPIASRACAATKRIRRGRPTIRASRSTRFAKASDRCGWQPRNRRVQSRPKIRLLARKPAAQPQLVSRRGGAPAWSPDGKTLLVTGLPDPEPVYNGNPLRNESEAPPLFALNAAFQLWRVPAPLPVHEDGGAVPAEITPSPALFGAVFDRVWTTLKSLYYSTGPAGGSVGERARQVPSARDGGEERSRPRDGHRRDGRGAAADQARRSLRTARSSSPDIRWRRKPAASPLKKAATSSMR